MGVGDQRHAPAALPAETNPVPILQEVGWNPGPVCTVEENLAPSGFDSRTVQTVASRHTDYATPSHNIYIYI
jgi:hypothetical protein